MKAPGIAEYKRVLSTMKSDALNSGETYLEITSKKLHVIVSPEHTTMPTCCHAMYRFMLEGDVILERPKGSSGLGSHLNIRYMLHDMESRALIMPIKKRGRPALSDKEKASRKKKKGRFNDKELMALLDMWLAKQGKSCSVSKEQMRTKESGTDWVFHCRGVRRGRKKTLPTHIFETFKVIDDHGSKHSIVVNEDYGYRNQWCEISKVVKERLSMSLLMVDKKGNIFEV